MARAYDYPPVEGEGGGGGGGGGAEAEHTFASLLSRVLWDLFDTLEQALKLFLKNPNFIVLSVLTYLPLFCFSVYHELHLRKTFSAISHALSRPSQYHLLYYDDSSDFSVSYYQTKSLTRDILPKITQAFALYLVPYHLLDLFSSILIVHSASAILADDQEPRSVKEMIRKAFKEARFRGPFITSLYVRLFTTCALIGLIWVVANFYILSRTNLLEVPYWDYDSYMPQPRKLLKQVLMGLIHGVAFLGLLTKYMEWSADWNMGLVLSIAEGQEEEGTCGIEALEVSDYMSRGCKRKGALLMLVFFLWGACLRLPCFNGGQRGEAERAGVMMTCVVMFGGCVGSAVKWVACLFYFRECKQRIVEKKFDEKAEAKSVVKAIVHENKMKAQAGFEAC